ncbi:MAG: hypothetical protein QOD28_714 [Acidobacteriota bacterium]|nr:hypothetical protein [Acidobacteriota bacterium]
MDEIVIRHCQLSKSYRARAARVAALVKLETGIEPRLAPGRLAEFAVRVNGATVARKGWLKLPPDEHVLAAVRDALCGRESFR